MPILLANFSRFERPEGWIAGLSNCLSKFGLILKVIRTCSCVVSGKFPTTGELRACGGIPRSRDVNCNGSGGTVQLASGVSTSNARSVRAERICPGERFDMGDASIQHHHALHDEINLLIMQKPE